MTGHLKTPQTQKYASVIIQKSEQTKENTQTCRWKHTNAQYCQDEKFKNITFTLQLQPLQTGTQAPTISRRVIIL